MITFHQDTELFVIDEYDFVNDNITESHTEVFKAGNLVDAEIVSEDGIYVQLEFGNGSQAFTVSRDCFDVLPQV